MPNKDAMIDLNVMKEKTIKRQSYIPLMVFKME